ncbi:MAG: tRNA uridine-5-carboxymethylaminomethyl(34) synthesis enzyme MnmG [bacterium]
MKRTNYDVIVVGGGHAGIEAAHTCAVMGVKTLLLTIDTDKIGQLSCNPAIGGLGKSQLVKEVDALGGVMGRLADSSCIQYRRLNSSKGPAVQSSRMQVDMSRYQEQARELILNTPKLEVGQDMVEDILVKNGRVFGIRAKVTGKILTKALILAPGTFLHGLIHIGMDHFAGGRMGDPSSDLLGDSLRNIGFSIGRFKTGTTPRLDGSSINFDVLEPQYGDKDCTPFSSKTRSFQLPQVPCYIANTTKRTHSIIKANLDRSPLYCGIITGTGVRYCPSVEDKIVKFPQRKSHHVFLEPEGLNTDLFYPNGISTSLPQDVQVDMVHSIKGLRKAKIVKYGYGIEHDYVEPTQLKATLETKKISNLFFAGQINGTTGYEEAAAQGLMAGINAALKIKKKEPFVLTRAQAYIGVLIDDLVTKGTKEPYRMFTSRAEYRLVLREDNADERLCRLGCELGLVSKEDYKKFNLRQKKISQELKRLPMVKIKATKALNKKLKQLGTSAIDESISLETLLKRPEVSYSFLAKLDKKSAKVDKSISSKAEINIKYEGYIKRQEKEIERFRSIERIRIPEAFDYKGIPGISSEIQEKLSLFKPMNLGQASRISGVTPAAISILMIYVSRKTLKKKRSK